MEFHTKFFSDFINVTQNSISDIKIDFFYTNKNYSTGRDRTQPSLYHWLEGVKIPGYTTGGTLLVRIKVEQLRLKGLLTDWLSDIWPGRLVDIWQFARPVSSRSPRDRCYWHSAFPGTSSASSARNAPRYSMGSTWAMKVPSFSLDI